MKKIFLLIISLFLFVPLAETSELAGRFGIGVNWPGVQLRYCVTDNFIAEVKAQFSSNNTIVGGRGYYIFLKVPGNALLFPYVGVEADGIISPYLTGGYTAGGFIGVEVLVASHIGIGADAGLYYVDLYSTRGTFNDYGLIFNGGLTYYF